MAKVKDVVVVQFDPPTAAQETSMAVTDVTMDDGRKYRLRTYYRVDQVEYLGKEGGESDEAAAES